MPLDIANPVVLYSPDGINVSEWLVPSISDNAALCDGMRIVSYTKIPPAKTMQSADRSKKKSK